MSLSTIRTQIDTMLAAVSNVGKTYQYQRQAKLDPDFKTLFFDTATSTIRFWEQTRTSTEEHYADILNRSTRTHKIKLDGFMGVDDSAASEKTFQDLVEAVVTAFRGKQDLNALAGLMNTGDPPQVNQVNLVQFGPHILHHAEIVLTVTERVTF